MASQPTYTIKIPRYLPPKVNDWRGRHWSKRAKCVSEYVDFLKAYGAAVPKATCPRRVWLHIFFPSGHSFPDKDAFDKDTLDALTQAGFLIDDSERGLVGRLDVTFTVDPTLGNHPVPMPTVVIMLRDAAPEDEPNALIAILMRHANAISMASAATMSHAINEAVRELPDVLSRLKGFGYGSTAALPASQRGDAPGEVKSPDPPA